MKHIALLSLFFVSISFAGAPYNPREIDQTISAREAQVKRDPNGAIGWAMLGEAWLERARESDLDDAAWKAEDAARRSLALRAAGNSRAQQLLVSSILEQHRFQDAHDLLASWGVKTMLMVDVLIELGRYGEAKALLPTEVSMTDAAELSIRGRLALCLGEKNKAIELYQQAWSAISGLEHLNDRTQAYFRIKLGEAYAANGNMQEAKLHLKEGLRMHPRSYKASLGLAKLAAQKGEWKSVITYAKKTLEICGSMDAKALMGDAYTALKQPKKAKEWYADCLQSYRDEVSRFDELGKGGAFKVKPVDRQFANFAWTHNMFLKDGLAAARRDHANRPDPHAQLVLQSLEKKVAQ